MKIQYTLLLIRLIKLAAMNWFRSYVQKEIGIKPINEEYEDNDVTLSVNNKLQKGLEVLSPTIFYYNPSYH